MIRSLNTLCVVTLVVGAVLPACSSKSSGNGSPTFTSSLPSSQSLGNLSDADESRLCSEISDFETKAAASVQSNPCKLQGIVAAGVAEAFGRGTVTDAQLQKACSDAEQSCAQTPARNFDAGTTTATCTKPTGTLHRDRRGSRGLPQRFGGAGEPGVFEGPRVFVSDGQRLLRGRGSSHDDDRKPAAVLPEVAARVPDQRRDDGREFQPRHCRLSPRSAAA